MKHSILLMIFVLFLGTVVFGQASPVLLRIGDEGISLEEFERIYRKNNNETSLNRQDPGDYLELFINFKLKVKEAEALGMDTTTKFVNELEGYRKQLAKPYLVDDRNQGGDDAGGLRMVQIRYSCQSYPDPLKRKSFSGRYPGSL